MLQSPNKSAMEATMEQLQKHHADDKGDVAIFGERKKLLVSTTLSPSEKYVRPAFFERKNYVECGSQGMRLDVYENTE